MSSDKSSVNDNIQVSSMETSELNDDVFTHYKILDDPFLIANIPILSQTISNTILEGQEVIKLHYCRQFLLKWIDNKWPDDIPI